MSLKLPGTKRGGSIHAMIMNLGLVLIDRLASRTRSKTAKHTNTELTDPRTISGREHRLEIVCRIACQKTFNREPKSVGSKPPIQSHATTTRPSSNICERVRARVFWSNVSYLPPTRTGTQRLTFLGETFTEVLQIALQQELPTSGTNAVNAHRDCLLSASRSRRCFASPQTKCPWPLHAPTTFFDRVIQESPETRWPTLRRLAPGW